MVGFGLGSLFLCLALGGGRGSVEAWYSTALDFEEVLSGLSESHVHVFVADVVKSFDTVNRGVLGLVLGRLGVPVWFRMVYFCYRANVRLRFKLACGLGSPWTGDGGIPHGCPLSMALMVALYLPGAGLWGLSLALGLSCMLIT